MTTGTKTKQSEIYRQVLVALTNDEVLASQGRTFLNSPVNLQNVHTPFDLCLEMLSKMEGFCGSFLEKDIATFNLEFVEVLISDFGVNPEKIWFFTDCFEKAAFAKEERYKGVNIMKEDFSTLIGRRNEPMKFDCVIGNPPYQDVNNKHASLWQDFVNKSFEICKDDGYVSLIHPSAWRKPGHNLFPLLSNKNMMYLEIHGNQDGMKTFNCGTRYDWYIVKNRLMESSYTTTILDENGKMQEIDIVKLGFIPHVHSDILVKCFTSDLDNRINVIHSRSTYGNDKPWMSKEKNETHAYPCVYSTPCNKPPVLLWSSRKNEHFGIPKIIIGKASPERCFYDKNGEYGVTNNCLAIVCDNEQEANSIIAVIKGEQFKNLMNACKWSGFSIEPEIFYMFKKDFWKEFVNEDGTEKV